MRALRRHPSGVLGVGLAFLTAAAAGVLLARLQLVALKDAERVAAESARMDGLRKQHEDPTRASTPALLTNAQGLHLYVRSWLNVPNQPRGVVLAVHGFSMHSGYFASLATLLNQRGLAVVSYDQQGQGLSDAYQGLRGYCRGFDDFVNDMALVLKWAAQLYPGKPLFLLGESMGGTVVLQGLRRPDIRAHTVSGAVLLAPAIRVSDKVLPPKFLIPVLQALAALFPRAPIPDDKVTNPQLWKSAFGDAEAAEAAWKDPLVTVVPPRLSMLGMVAVFEDLYAHLEEINAPFLVLHSPADAHTSYNNSEVLLARAASSDKQLLPIHGKHMLLMDRPKITEKALEAVASWLDAHC